MGRRGVDLDESIWTCFRRYLNFLAISAFVGLEHRRAGLFLAIGYVLPVWWSESTTQLDRLRCLLNKSSSTVSSSSSFPGPHALHDMVPRDRRAGSNHLASSHGNTFDSRLSSDHSTRLAHFCLGPPCASAYG